MLKIITLHLELPDIKLLHRLLETIEVPTEDEEELRRYLEDLLTWNHAR